MHVALSKKLDEKLTQMVEQGKIEACVMARAIQNALHLAQKEDKDENQVVRDMALEFGDWAGQLLSTAECELSAKKPVNVVSVIDCTDADNFALQSIKSWPDTDIGNAHAEAYFRELLEEQEVSEEDIEVALEEGKYEIGEGFYAITHST